MRELGCRANYACEWRTAYGRITRSGSKHSGSKHARIAGDSPSQHGHATGQHCDTAGEYCYAAGRHCDTAVHTTGSAGNDVTEPESHSARTDHSGGADSRQHDATIYD